MYDQENQFFVMVFCVKLPTEEILVNVIVTVKIIVMLIPMIKMAVNMAADRFLII